MYPSECEYCIVRRWADLTGGSRALRVCGGFAAREGFFGAGARAGRPYTRGSGSVLQDELPSGPRVGTPSVSVGAGRKSGTVAGRSTDRAVKGTGGSVAQDKKHDGKKARESSRRTLSSPDGVRTEGVRTRRERAVGATSRS